MRPDETLVTGAGGTTDPSRYWWIFLGTGTLWLLFGVSVFRFSWDEVSPISILFGVVMLVAAVDEVITVFGTKGGWRLVHGALGVLYAILAIVAFVHPGNTFAALAAILSFYFVVKGIFDVAVALTTGGGEGRWLRLAVGVAELLLGFWAAGDFGHQTILLVVWVAAVAFTRGIGQLVFAFALKRGEA